MNSMTGYGCAKARGKDFTVNVEIQSYNHRFLDTKIILPEEYLMVEREVAQRVAERLARGRINLFIAIRHGSRRSSVKIDAPLAQKYWWALNRLKKKLGIRGELEPGIILNLPGVFCANSGRPSHREFKDRLMVALNSALGQLVKMRKKEGGKLRLDLLRHLRTLKNSLGLVEERVAARQLPEEQEKDQAEKRPGDVDGAVRPTVEEELARLKSHAEQFENLLDKREPIGKILDFVSLEMHREATTLGDKAVDTVISQQVVLMKSEIENLREQIRNVE